MCTHYHVPQETLDHKSGKCRNVAGGRGQRKNEMRDRKCLIQSSPAEMWQEAEGKERMK